MKLSRALSGFTLLFSSALWGKVIETITGYSNILGWVAVTSVLAFIGGAMFMSGVTSRGSSGRGNSGGERECLN